jgi:hypothetical protein
MLRNIIIFCVVSASLESCDVRNRDKQANINGPSKQVEIKDPTTVQVIDTAYNFGKVTDGEIVTYNYRFVNTGKKPLIVTEATASCGCTVPEKPTEPIQPGDTGYIKVKFNSEKRVGQAHKTINVQSNAEPAFPPMLLAGEVLEKKK